MKFHFIGGEWDGQRLDENSPGKSGALSYNHVVQLTNGGEIGARVHLLGRPPETGTRKSVEYEVTERQDDEIILRPL